MLTKAHTLTTRHTGTKSNTHSVPTALEHTIKRNTFKICFIYIHGMKRCINRKLEETVRG